MVRLSVFPSLPHEKTGPLCRAARLKYAPHQQCSVR